MAAAQASVFGSQTSAGEFIDENGGGAGVRLSKRQQQKQK